MRARQLERDVVCNRVPDVRRRSVELESSIAASHITTSCRRADQAVVGQRELEIDLRALSK